MLLKHSGPRLLSLRTDAGETVLDAASSDQMKTALMDHEDDSQSYTTILSQGEGEREGCRIVRGGWKCPCKIGVNYIYFFKPFPYTYASCGSPVNQKILSICQFANWSRDILVIVILQKDNISTVKV